MDIILYLVGFGLVLSAGTLYNIRVSLKKEDPQNYLSLSSVLLLSVGSWATLVAGGSLVLVLVLMHLMLERRYNYKFYNKLQAWFEFRDLRKDKEEHEN